MQKLLLILCTLIFLGCQQKVKVKPFSKNVNNGNPQVVDSVRFLDCFHGQLSAMYNFKVHCQCIPQNEFDDSCIVSVIVYSKASSKIVDSIRYTIIHDKIYGLFQNCKESQSLSIEKNIDGITQDNYVGEFIVGDFNFDSREDLALIKNRGNRGAQYIFFVQDENRKFIIDYFLTDSMSNFPDKINKDKMTLSTLIHANVTEQGERVYQRKKGVWKLVNHRYIQHQQ